VTWRRWSRSTSARRGDDPGETKPEHDLVCLLRDTSYRATSNLLRITTLFRRPPGPSHDPLYNLKLNMAPFKPSRADVYNVRALLASRKLPNELVLTVLEHAHYWVERQHYCSELKILMDEDFSSEYSAAVPYLAMAAFPRRPRLGSEAAKIREIEFLVVSHGKRHIPAYMDGYANLLG
jgi:hypothetical protein